MPSRIAALVLALAALCACSRREFSPYSPHENILSVAAEFQLLAASDPYRDPPPEELTDQNIARATLVRLANYESLHPDRFSAEVAFLKGCAFERLHDHESARDAFRLAAAASEEVRPDAERRAAANEALLRVRTPEAMPSSLEETLSLLDRQRVAFERLAEETEDPLYAALARCEQEQAEVGRAELIAANRMMLADGERQALEAAEALVANHRESARALEHALRLASFRRRLAEEELRLNPPETLRFDRARTLAHLDACLDVLHRVSQADGRPERLVARHELDAVLALRDAVLDRAD